MKIILELDHDVDLHLLKLTLLDAFGEFVSHRGPSAAAYVEKRYPGDSVYMGEQRAKKIQQVLDRCRLAEQLHHATFQMRIES